MKKYLSIGIVLLLSISYFIAVGRPWSVRKNTLPKVGAFFNPFSGFSKNAISIKNWQSYEVDGLESLQDEVEVYMDKNLVPHIKGVAPTDVYYAQGYIHAKYRLWQMDFSYRAVAGKLSEVIGKKALEYDILQLKMGHDYAVEQRLKSWKSCPETLAFFEAYVDGVNAYIENLKQGDYPIEFKLLNYKPERWTLEKSAYIYIGMCADLANGDHDIENTNVASVIGDSTFHFLFPDSYTKQHVIVPFEGPLKPMEDAKQRKASILDNSIGHLERPSPVKGIGSNNWVVGASKSASGAPILASDPHLSLRLPAVWFENQLASTDFNSYGVSIPGLPSVVIGFNQHIAWAMTNFGHDFRDWYVIDWADKEKTSYFIEGQQQKVKYRKHNVKIAYDRDTTVEIKYTKIGPVWESDTDDKRTQDLTMHWLLFEDLQNCDFDFFIKINKGSTFDDYLDASKHFLFPPQNIIFASLDGDIAIRCQGAVPLKDKDQGKFLSTLGQKDDQWLGFIPFSELPMLHNPDRGFLFSANQHSTTPNYPYYYSGSFEGYRSRRLYEELSKKDRWDTHSFMSLQQDVYGVKAAEALPLFLDAVDRIALNEDQLIWLDRMQKWDYNYGPNDEEPTFFELWFQKAEELTFDEILCEEENMSIRLPEDWRFVELVESFGDHSIFDIQETDETEYAGDVIQDAFLLAYEEFHDYPEDQKGWAKYRNVRVEHMARISAFSRTSLHVGGNDGTVNAIQSTHGPSWRMVVGLGNKVEAFGVYPGGQDGNPGSPYYDNFIDLWEKGAYNEIHYMTDWTVDPSTHWFTINLRK